MKRDTNDGFIMRPKVDFCFKELMEDAEVRRGFIAAVLHILQEVAARARPDAHWRPRRRDKPCG